MESALPSEIIAFIVALANDARVRLVSRRFMKMTNEAILDNKSERAILALKGDLFSWLIRFGDARDPFPAAHETNSILFYVTQRASNYIAKDVIADSIFKKYNVAIFNREIVKSVFGAMFTNNITIKFDRFRTGGLNHILHTLRGDAQKYSWIPREINYCINSQMLLRDKQQSVYMSCELGIFAGNGSSETQLLCEIIRGRIRYLMDKI